MTLADRLALGYHAISPRWPAVLSVTPERFERQLRRLADRGYSGVTFSELVLGRGSGPRVAVTFDDGYASVLARGLPILERLGWPATVFVPSALIGRGRPLAWPGIDHWFGTEHEHELTPLGWDELAGLAAGGWEIGSHTRTHPRLPELDDRALAYELAASRDECEAGTGTACLAISYPYGAVDGRVVAAARRAGYATGAALPRGRSGSGALDWPRIGVYHADDDRWLAVKLSRAVRVMRRTPAWDGALALRRRRVGA